MDKFTKPRFCILISPRSSCSLVRLAQFVEFTQLQFFFLASTLSGLIGWRPDWTPWISGSTLLWNKLSLVESQRGFFFLSRTWFCVYSLKSAFWLSVPACGSTHFPPYSPLPLLAQLCFFVFLHRKSISLPDLQAFCPWSLGICI